MCLHSRKKLSLVANSHDFCIYILIDDDCCGCHIYLCVILQTFVRLQIEIYEMLRVLVHPIFDPFVKNALAQPQYLRCGGCRDALIFRICIVCFVLRKILARFVFVVHVEVCLKYTAAASDHDSSFTT